MTHTDVVFFSDADILHKAAVTESEAVSKDVGQVVTQIREFG